MTAYKDKAVVEFVHTKQFHQDGAREARITLGTHSGTHIDAPAHFTDRGATIDHLNLEAVIGPCRVIDCSLMSGGITGSMLEPMDIQSGERILIKTANSDKHSTAGFHYDFVYLAADGARYLADKKVKTVGIDYLGIERHQPDHATHSILFDASITIIEGLRLANVEPGVYHLYCLPLLLEGLEAAPARAILIR